MKVKLYKQFDHWYKGGTIWLFSDPHFNDPETKEQNPDWPDADEIVKSINYNLSKHDTIIFLGDIGDVEYIKKIKGYKVLIMGNHDSGASNYIKRYHVSCNVLDSTPNESFSYDTDDYNEAIAFLEEVKADFSSYTFKIVDNGLFDEVYEGPLFINDKVLLSHEPIELKFGYNVHGHTHFGSPVIIEKNRISVNIAADVANYQKIRLDTIYNLGKVDDIHRITINRAIERKNNV